MYNDGDKIRMERAASEKNDSDHPLHPPIIKKGG